MPNGDSARVHHAVPAQSAYMMTMQPPPEDSVQNSLLSSMIRP